VTRAHREKKVFRGEKGAKSRTHERRMESRKERRPGSLGILETEKTFRISLGLSGNEKKRTPVTVRMSGGKRADRKLRH